MKRTIRQRFWLDIMIWHRIVNWTTAMTIDKQSSVCFENIGSFRFKLHIYSTTPTFLPCMAKTRDLITAVEKTQVWNISIPCNVICKRRFEHYKRRTEKIRLVTPCWCNRFWLCSRVWELHVITSPWRLKGLDSVSNHQRHDYLLKRLFRRRSNNTSKLRITGLCAGNWS